MKIVLDELQGGLKKCEKLFINTGSEGSSESRSTLSESATTNLLDAQEAMEHSSSRQYNDSDGGSTFMQTFDARNSSMTKDSVITSSVLNDQSSTLQSRTILESGASPLLSQHSPESPILTQRDSATESMITAEESKEMNKGLSVLQKL